MRFEWDESKNESNRIKHGIDFRDAAKVFDEFTYTESDERFDYGEQRFLTFGLLFGEVVAISHTENDELIRIISVRKAERNEQEAYYKNIRD
ncbi:MAG: BrnT family toxin [Pyrinomonadaceae bacterium]